MMAFEDLPERRRVFVADGWPHAGASPPALIQNETPGMLHAKRALPVSEANANSLTKESAKVLGAKIGDARRLPQ